MHLRRLLSFVILLSIGMAPMKIAAADAPARPVKAALWIGGFAHDFEKIAETMRTTLPEHLPIELEVVRDGRFLDSPRAAELDLILMNHCHKSAEGVLTQPQKEKLLALVRGGVGVVAIHASYYSFLDWDEVHELFGTRWIKHGDVDIYITVTLTDREHPIAANLSGSIETHSELYYSEPLAKDCHLLARASEKGAEQQNPSVWTRMYGQGRIVTILPGHWPDAYEKRDFQMLIANSAAWAARRVARDTSMSKERFQ